MQNSNQNQGGNVTGNNTYNVPQKVWSRLDHDDQIQFNKAFQRMERRTQEIISSLSVECQTQELRSHFAEIAAATCAAFLPELNEA